MDSSPFKLLVLLSLLVSFQVANASLDRLHGPREFVPSSSISSLTRQLLEAVLLGDFNLANVTSILTAGADPNAYDENQMTALHWAVIKGQNETVKTLLARGAYTDALDASYRTPAHFLGIYGEACEEEADLT
uniref:Ankyrin repeat domain-containing protein 54 n=1 Tax=Guillardia theta TaxID=55529 RepID=A0A6U6BTB3_GUITH|mmetsp:Transcript_41616/g.131157  ORF Transcript_41616/g.131157 Transcript_41616/m.131157 type:complete len:133 (+) Transcript_41616:473-871(+)